MKKAISMLLMATMLLGILAGCGSGDTSDATDNGSKADSETAAVNGDASGDSTAGGEVNVYVHMTQLILGDEKQDADGNTYRDESTAWLKFAAEDFTAETGIEVNLMPYSDMNTDIVPLLQVSDASVDVFTYGSPLSREEREMYLEPLMSVDEASDIYDQNYVDAMVKNTAGDQIMIWAMGKTYNNGIAYNENVLKAAGFDAVPDTLDEFIAMCEKIRDNGQTPISLHRVENWPLYTVGEFASYIDGEYDAMKDLLDSDDPFGEGSSVGKMIKIYTDFKSRKFFEQEIYADFGVAMDSVAHGNAGMMLFGSWVVPQLQSRVLEGTEAGDIKFDAAVDYGSGRHITVETGFGWAMSKASENKDNAQAFLDYISKRSDMIAETGSINGRTDVEAVVPDLYQLINDKIEAGTVTPIYAKEKTEAFYQVEEILTDADLFADNKYVGLMFDAYDVENPSWDAYNQQVETQNQLFFTSKEFLGY